MCGSEGLEDWRVWMISLVKRVSGGGRVEGCGVADCVGVGDGDGRKRQYDGSVRACVCVCFCFLEILLLPLSWLAG